MHARCYATETVHKINGETVRFLYDPWRLWIWRRRAKLTVPGRIRLDLPSRGRARGLTPARGPSPALPLAPPPQIHTRRTAFFDLPRPSAVLDGACATGGARRVFLRRETCVRRGAARGTT